MKAHLLVVLAITLSGCAVQVQTDTADVDEPSHTSQSCTVNGRPCVGPEPTGPNETIDIHQVISLTMGADETVRFSVHPGANVTSLRVRLAGMDGGPVGAGTSSPCLELTGPSTHQSRGGCRNSVSTTVVVDGAVNSDAWVDRDHLSTGDWSVHVESGPIAISVVIDASVTY